MQKLILAFVALMLFSATGCMMSPPTVLNAGMTTEERYPSVARHHYNWIISNHADSKEAEIAKERLKRMDDPEYAKRKDLEDLKTAAAARMKNNRKTLATTKDFNACLDRITTIFANIGNMRCVLSGDYKNSHECLKITIDRPIYRGYSDGTYGCTVNTTCTRKYINSLPRDSKEVDWLQFELYESEGCDYLTVNHMIGGASSGAYDISSISIHKSKIYGKVLIYLGCANTYCPGSKERLARMHYARTDYYVDSKRFSDIGGLIDSRLLLSSSKVTLTDGFREELRIAEYARYADRFRNARNSGQLDDFVKMYADYYDPDKLVAQARVKYKAARLAEYRDEFRSASTSQKLNDYISKYASYDPEGLVKRASARLPAVIESERRARQVAEESSQGYVIVRVDISRVIDFISGIRVHNLKGSPDSDSPGYLGWDRDEWANSKVINPGYNGQVAGAYRFEAKTQSGDHCSGVFKISGRSRDVYLSLTRDCSHTTVRE